MGSSLKTSLQKPFTIMETARSISIPRWRHRNICSSLTFDVVASCSTMADLFRLSMYGKVCAPHWSPINSESHSVKLRAPSARGPNLTKPRYTLELLRSDEHTSELQSRPHLVC